MARSKRYKSIPTKLSESEFNEFVLPHLTKGSRGPSKKLSFYLIFHYILKLLHTGCQWEELPIEKDERGFPEIHYSNIFRIFQRWILDGCFKKIFVERLFGKNLFKFCKHNFNHSNSDHIFRVSGKDFIAHECSPKVGKPRYCAFNNPSNVN